MSNAEVKERLVAFTPAWFEEAFKHHKDPIPEDIRNVAVRIVETHDIRGICDPMYIANVTALEMKRGDGQGGFEQGDPVYMEDREALIDKTAQRLAFAYASSLRVTKEAMRDALIETLRY